MSKLHALILCASWSLLPSTLFSADPPAAKSPVADSPAAKDDAAAKSPADPKPDKKADAKPKAKQDKKKSSPDESLATRSVEELTERTKKSLVVVTFSGRDGGQEGLGSGFVISADGLIATNRHVIGDARPVKVQFANGKQHDVVSVHASDRLLDLAILKIDAQDLPVLALGDSDSLKQGQAIVAFGNPQGLKHSVVTGVVSGVREIEGRSMIQLAVPIEPGNSGGPLVDMQGRVHGILTMKSLVTANLGFAVPINALKPLLAKPNPILMARWLTIGQLDARAWKPLAGANWRQRAGRIMAAGTGPGFGGRSICLSELDVPEVPFELAVAVKMDDESGAAGLVFGSDGDQRHWGFYPSNGKIRLSRFDGPDVLSWSVLHDEASDSYRPNDWNTLRIRVEKDKIECYVNDQLAVTHEHDNWPGMKVGLAKFRQTQAEFKSFRVARQIAPDALPAGEVEKIARLVEELPVGKPPASSALAALAASASTSAVLRSRAKALEQQAAELRKLAATVYNQRVIADLVAALSSDEEKIDLFRAGLLIAKLDNDELDVDAYCQELRRLGDDLRGKLAKDADSSQKLDALRKYLFEENGFHGSRHDYYNRANSYLNEVLDDREGLPITLAVLYMELARAIDLPVVGIGLPGHFVAGHVPHGSKDVELIDVYEDARPLSRDEAARRVRESADRELVEEDLRPTSKRAIIVRMLHNLLGVAGQAGKAGEMLRYLNAIVAVEPDSVSDRSMRAIVAYQAEQFDTAMQDIDWLLDHEQAGVNLDRVRELRNALERRRQQ